MSGLSLAPVDGSGPPVRVGSPQGRSNVGRFSPDGRHIAFVSDESGRREVYVQERPPATRAWKVSVSGGDQPRWNRNGRELFFVSERGMETVDVITRPAFSAGTPRLLFPLPASSIPTLNGNGWDVTPDGQGFLLAQRRSDRVDNPIIVVLNWWAALEGRP
jgi:dipeptidyl aminopeptidase/acylaminoacyl peptidase